MPQISETKQARNFPNISDEIYYPSSTADKEIVYPEQREDDMGESSHHNNLRTDLFLFLKLFFKNREDVFFREI